MQEKQPCNDHWCKFQEGRSKVKGWSSKFKEGSWFSKKVKNNVLFFSFSCHTQIGDKPKKDLAKCGYKTNRKVEKIKNHTIWRGPTRIYYLNVAIFKEDN